MCIKSAGQSVCVNVMSLKPTYYKTKTKQKNTKIEEKNKKYIIKHIKKKLFKNLRQIFMIIAPTHR